MERVKQRSLSRVEDFLFANHFGSVLHKLSASFFMNACNAGDLSRSRMAQFVRRNPFTIMEVALTLHRFLSQLDRPLWEYHEYLHSWNEAAS